ncbi:hypothetical protein Lal_00034914 [Lupinus albus]|uniref:Putative transcription factor MYB-HB-like family n=1 Tax=Lupinus albus TaxID=3870 RepID=A0A6A5PL70_LUPAL|nr:putative transcription factor MYB-HB-like family [Lupinus albus]KAF1897211.1 hypothetical protein Lal_00034914 [Lupinus albus]
MVRTPYCDKSGMRKGTWTSEEDKKLIAYVTRYGCWNWRQLPKFAGLQRCGKSCRLRWLNYLRPNIKRGNFTKEEEEIIIRLHNKLGNRWSIIATHLQGRTDNEIKNYWHTSLKKISQQTNVTNENSKASSKPKDNESNLGSSSVPNNVSVQVTPPTTTSQISGSITSSLSPLSSSSEFSSMSWGHTNSTTKLMIEDDFPFLDDAFWTKSDLADISYTPPSEIVQDDSNTVFQSLDNTQIIDTFSPQYQSSSKSMVFESNFGSFLDGETKIKMDNFWTQPFVPDVCHVPNQLLTPLEAESQYYSGVDFWGQNDNDCYLYEGELDLV